MIYNNAIELIGNTPILKLNNMAKDSNIFVKLEKFNPGGSIKDRAALGMIEEAEKEGLLRPGVTIVEPTSGNTGIGLAMIGKLKGYKVIIVMPETMSKERRDLIKAYGAELVLTDGSKGMMGAIEKALEYKKKGGYFIPQQFDNKANADIHYKTTAEEINRDIPDLDYVIISVGTGGTISGVGKKLKEKNPNIKVIAVEPANSPVLSGGKPGAHKIQGIGAGFIPEVYDGTVVDEVMQITDNDAINATKEFVEKEGILVGISTGSVVFAAKKLAEKVGNDKKILVVSPDGGEKYISMGIFA